MAKNIVVCSDGTGNTAIKGRGTNVFKLFEAVDLNGHRSDARLDVQIAFYDDGVGTENFKPLRLLGGAMGLGLGRNVRQLYKELARVYDPGDRIFLFGFSRGAFTVRTLAGMIGACGLIDGTQRGSARDLHNAVEAAYSAYRKGYDSALTGLLRRMRGQPRGRTAAVDSLHRAYRVHRPVPIAFIGVWDTVDAVGLPFALSGFVNRVIYQFKFPTQDLGSSVQCACQALSIDEPRVSFKPVLWNDVPAVGEDHATPRSPEAERRIDQVWFAGVHSNVGGGYPKQGLSLVALDWMLRNAKKCGLRLNDMDLSIYAGHASVDDKVYDPRSGFGVFYRWSPRSLVALCRDSHVMPRVHLSVAERLAHGTDDYAPGNLPPNTRIVITETDDPIADGIAGMRARNVERVIQAAHKNQGDLLTGCRSAIAASEVSYWLFMAAWAFLLAGAIGVMAEGSTPSAVAAAAWQVATSLMTMQLGQMWGTLRDMWQSWWRIAILASAVSLALAWLLSHLADGLMSNAFSSFWHKRQQALREALKSATREARDRYAD